MIALLIATGIAALTVMGLTQKFGVSWLDTDSSARVTGSGDSVGDTEIGLDFVLGTGTVTDQEQQIGFDVANLKGFLLVVTGNDATTVVMKTNSTGSPALTLTVPIGGGEMVWSNRSPQANPFGSTDVTTLYFTKSGSDTPRVQIRILLNA